MLSLKQPIEDTIKINGKEYELDLSFDNVLRWYELMEDKSIDDGIKILIAFEMFVPECEADIETQIETIQRISRYIAGRNDGDEDNADQTKYYSFSEDAEYIFASFLQEYGIDLIEQQGSMRWEKFIALFRGMRDNTKINQIIGIRAAALPSGNSEYEKSERERLLQLKAIYAFDEEQSVAAGDAQMDEMFSNLVNLAKEGGKYK